MSLDAYDELETEIRRRKEAEKKVKELEKKIEEVKPLMEIFHKKEKTRGSRTFGSQMDTLITALLSDGRSCRSVKSFLVNLTEIFPFLLHQNEACEVSIPSITYIEVNTKKVLNSFFYKLNIFDHFLN